MYHVEKNDKTPTLVKALGISHACAIAVMLLAGLLFVKTTNQDKTAIKSKADFWKEF
jgi:hypothetical protein